jgi:DNA polymerase III alpha subunit
VEPGTCLAPSTGIAPDAGRALRVGFKYLKQMGDRSLDRIEEERHHGPFTSFEDFYLRTRIDFSDWQRVRAAITTTQRRILTTSLNSSAIAATEDTQGHRPADACRPAVAWACY